MRVQNAKHEDLEGVVEMNRLFHVDVPDFVWDTVEYVAKNLGGYHVILDERGAHELTVESFCELGVSRFYERCGFTRDKELGIYGEKLYCRFSMECVSAGKTPSSCGEGTISRIVPELNPGAGVVTSRGDVHYVVTEFGIADLFGKSVRERARLLIGIAHPDFRPELEKAAKARRLL